MSTGHIYYLKDGILNRVVSGTLQPVDEEDALSDHDKAGLIIDDSYFFYVGMENVSVSGKKLHSVAEYYLNVLFPSDMIKKFGIFQNSGKTIIYIINEEIINTITEHEELFSSFKKISTPFLELCTKYNEFIYKDNQKMYRLAENMVTMYNDDTADYISSKDFIENVTAIKYSMQLPGVQKKSLAKIPIFAPAALLAVIYIAFVITSLAEISAYKKIDKVYNEWLQTAYSSAGLNNAKDPYNELLKKSKSTSGESVAERTIFVIQNLAAAKIEGIKLQNINIRDNDIRVEGTAENFAQVDELKKAMENKLQNAVNVDDTKKTKEGISFVMKYSKSNG